MTSPPGGREVVAVVVVTYNSAGVLPGLVASLPAAMGDLGWHLVVVDNDSADGTPELARQLAPAARVVPTGRNAGYAAGINAGCRAAGEHSCVLVLNPDVRLGPGCVPELVRALRVPGTGIAVPRLDDRNGERIASLRREPTLLRMLADALIGAERAGRHRRLGEVVTDERAYAVEGVTDWAEGSTLLIGAECLARCGPWDESFFLYSEETEFALRARDHGFATRYVPTARAVHLEGTGTPAQWALLALNKVRLYRRRHGRVATAAFWAALLLREAGRGLLGRANSRAATAALVSPARLREAPGPQVLRH